ncbi:hypothetical protein A6R68_24251 [Neotoma lepida]|uniref:Uncharacterized protein n=1 Tax=Neotoma lepida TaxID=56216 RepID=A0A1A6HU50_NEOLE|nr:hypothetical protein A6R68_24251 [Neotoma lepida]
MEMSMDVFQKKNYEKDLLDQEKEREELLFLEMEQLEKEKHQNDGRSCEKSFEKKRKEIKKSKLVRSQSFNNQAFHAKYGSLDKCASKSSTLAHTPSVSGLKIPKIQSLSQLLGEEGEQSAETVVVEKAPVMLGHVKDWREKGMSCS